MKIGIVAAWNTNSGVAMHAEPIGKEFINMGHKVTVFSFKKNDYHGEGITAKDEPYVKRCFGTRIHTNFFDPRPFLTTNMDVLIIEDVGMLPVEKIANIFPVLKKKCKNLFHMASIKDLESRNAVKSWKKTRLHHGKSFFSPLKWEIGL